MKKFVAIMMFAAFLLGACSSEKVVIDGRFYSSHRINQKPSTSY